MSRSATSGGRALAILLLAALGPAGCKKETAAPSAPQQQQQAKWHCPMHPGYVSDRPGQCPICSMDLVPIQSGDKGPAPPPGKGRVLLYRSAMNPTQTSPVARKDEMGMDYVPVYENEVAAAGGPPGFATVTIDAQRQQLIGLRTAAVSRGPFAGTIRTVGRVIYDETRVHHVHTKYEAYVERLNADFTGKYVRKGEPLLSIYSPDLLAAEQEYLLALRMPKAEGAGAGGAGMDLAASARRRLLLWDISAADIAALEKSGEPSRTLNLYAPLSGYVVNKTVFRGMRVRPEDTLFDIVDLSRVWALADVYEYELPRVKLGQRASMTLSYWQGRTWQGRLSYIFPSVDPKTRTVKVRLEFDNPDVLLKADMFADVVIQVDPRTALLVPEDAVLETGTRRMVFLALGEGRLQPREIEAGDRAGGMVEVRSGLAEGEQVARGASFLVDSESRLQAAIAAMVSPAAGDAKQPQPDGGPAPGGHEGHGGHAGHGGTP